MPREFVVVRVLREEASTARQAFNNGIEYYFSPTGCHMCKAAKDSGDTGGCHLHSPAIAKLRDLRRRFSFPDSVRSQAVPLIEGD